MTLLIAAGAVLALMVSTLTIWRFFAPSIERNNAVADAILGKAAVHDRAGGIIEEKQLGLVDRTTTLEKAVALIANQDARIKSTEQHLIAVDARLDGIDTSIGLLAGSAFERGAEAALKAAQKVTIDVDPEP